MKTLKGNQSNQGLSPEELEQLLDEVAETLIPRESFKFELCAQLRRTHQAFTTEEHSRRSRLANALNLVLVKLSWKRLPSLLLQTALGVVMIGLIIVFWGQI